MRQITATQFKARCLALMDEVAASPFGVAAGGWITGDLIAPVLEPSDWTVLQL